MNNLKDQNATEEKSINMIREKIKDLEERQKRDKILKLGGLPKENRIDRTPPHKKGKDTIEENLKEDMTLLIEGTYRVARKM